MPIGQLARLHTQNYTHAIIHMLTLVIPMHTDCKLTHFDFRHFVLNTRKHVNIRIPVWKLTTMDI